MLRWNWFAKVSTFGQEEKKLESRYCALFKSTLYSSGWLPKLNPFSGLQTTFNAVQFRMLSSFWMKTLILGTNQPYFLVLWTNLGVTAGHRGWT